MDPNERAMLEEFYNESRRPLQGRSAGRRTTTPINEDVDGNGFHSKYGGVGNSFTFRRRRVDDSDGYNDSNNDADADGVGNGGGHYQHSNGDGDSSQPRKSKSHQHRHLTWNRLNAALFAGQALLSAATSAPVTLVPTMAVSLAGDANDGDEEWNYAPYYSLETLEVYDGTGTRRRWIPFRVRTRTASKNNQNRGISSSSVFASHLTSVATLVTAFGKFINGVLVDVAGARRLLILYGICTCIALIGLRLSRTPNWAVGCCAAVEFFSSVNWPAGIVILGAHYGINHGNDDSNNNGRFERGLYVTSLASRCGSLLAIPLSSLVIKWTDLTWRGVAGLAACAALCGVVVFYLYLTDSPGKVHDPQNPIQTLPQSADNYDNGTACSPYHPSYDSWSTQQQAMFRRTFNLCSSVFCTVLPSIRVILISRVFWAVAAAHAGATMVKSSERILGTYFRDTSSGAVAEGKAGAMTVFLSLGMLGGLLVGGKAFARAADSEQGGRVAHNQYNKDTQDIESPLGQQSPLIDSTQLGTKNMIAFFYCLSICMCYLLSFLAMPFVRRVLRLPSLVLILQVLATLGLGFGVAVQFYHIPAIVGATYGKSRGLYTAYTDGIAALVSSVMWHLVGGAVEEGNPQSGGWAYGWAAMALLLIFCGTLMVKIVELYFVGGGWRHDARDHRHDQPSATLSSTGLGSIDMNSSWMDDEYSTAFSIDAASPLRRPSGSLNILPKSALQFIGSPGRAQSRRKLSPSIDFHHGLGETVGKNAETDLLGIDDDGSLLFLSARQLNASMQDDLVSFNSMLSPRKDLRDNDSCIRESSVFDDPNYDDSSFEL